MQLPDDLSGPPEKGIITEAYIKEVMKVLTHNMTIPPELLEDIKQAPVPIKSNWTNEDKNKDESPELHPIPSFYQFYKPTPKAEDQSMLKSDPFKEKKSDFNPYPEEPSDPMDMWWHCNDGRKLLVSQMETRHMFYALRLHFNRHMPKKFQIGIEEDQKLDHRKVLAEDKRAFRILFHQIQKRDNITEDQLQQLAHMARVLRMLP